MRFATALAARACALLLAGAAGGVPAADLLWRVSGPGATLHLAGSVHLLRESDLPLPPAWDAAWLASDALLLEVDFDAQPVSELQALAAELGTLPRDARLRRRVAPATWQAVSRAARTLGLRPGDLARHEPWYAALTLFNTALAQAGFAHALGVDRVLAERAGREGRAVDGLETARAQLAAFDGLSPAVQERFLGETLAGLADPAASAAALVEAWRQGDAARLADLLHDSFGAEPELHAALFERRHAAWLPTLEARLSAGPDTLVVVGALHLVGAGGLPEMLRAKGYRVERL